MMRSRIVPRARLLRRAALAFLAVLLAGLTLAGRTAEAGSGPHPLYDDGGTLRWYTDLREACRAAEREGKLILVDVSTVNCRACETAIGLMRDPSIRRRIARVAIGYHVDARRGTPLIGDFRANMRNATYLPLVGIFTPGIEWVSGFAPSRRTSNVELRRRFLVALDRAEARHRRMPRVVRRPAQPRASTPRADPAPKPRPAPPAAPAARETPPPKPRAAPVRPKTPKPARPAARTVAKPDWYVSISEAKTAARAEGKIIFVTSTKPSCGLCKKLKEKIVPQVRREMSRGCVFYIYDITRPESRAVDRLVRGGLPNARLMPLAGFMTPDMRWLHGFYGSTDAQKLMADYRTALRNR